MVLVLLMIFPHSHTCTQLLSKQFNKRCQKPSSRLDVVVVVSRVAAGRRPTSRRRVAVSLSSRRRRLVSSSAASWPHTGQRHGGGSLFRFRLVSSSRLVVVSCRCLVSSRCHRPRRGQTPANVAAAGRCLVFTSTHRLTSLLSRHRRRLVSSLSSSRHRPRRGQTPPRRRVKPD